MSLKTKFILSSLIGILAGIGTFYLPVSTIYKGAHLGDLCPPLYGIKHFISGIPAYEGLFFNNSPVVAYPFTTMLTLYPFALLPTKFAGPLFFSVSSFFFTYALLFDGKLWRLLVLLSPAYIFSLHSMQFTPLLASALVLPFLLPLATIKPQLGIVLFFSGRWNIKLFSVTAAFIILSFIIYPSWLTDWLITGNLSTYAGRMPLLNGFGLVLLLSFLKWRDRNSRILATMSLVPQRLWYDQLMLFLIPEKVSHLCVLLLGSWLSFFVSMRYDWLFKDELQHPGSWMLVVNFVYLPSLVIIYEKELYKLAHTLKASLSPAAKNKNM